jgi:nanoRNase/pAp phosphatase (c-di-AMP/oligoRNAs hydrolase)
MIISVNIAKTKMEEFHYDVTGDQLKIYLSPRTNSFGQQDIKATTSSWKYDLIIVLDSPDLESLGKIYTENREFFYERPIINIDYSPANENFGQMNLIDLTSGSTCGVLYNLVKTWGEHLFDADINTCLLTGIIDKTKSFKAGLINPQTLRMSGHLIEQKARREEIVKHLYYNRDLATLKLWGRILTRLKEYYNGKLVTAAVGTTDFTETNTSEQNLPDIIDELISTIPGVDLIILLWQKENNQIGGLVKSLGVFDPVKSLANFTPGGDKNLAKFTLTGNDLTQAETQILEEIKKTYQPNF